MSTPYSATCEQTMPTGTTRRLQMQADCLREVLITLLHHTLDDWDAMVRGRGAPPQPPPSRRMIACGGWLRSPDTP